MFFKGSSISCDGRLTHNGLVYNKFTGKLGAHLNFEGGERFVVSQQAEAPMQVNSLLQSESNDSRRVWHSVTYALKTGDNESAAACKNTIEENQRVIAKSRTATFEPRYFSMVSGTENNTPSLYQFVGDKQAHM